MRGAGYDSVDDMEKKEFNAETTDDDFRRRCDGRRSTHDTQQYNDADAMKRKCEDRRLIIRHTTTPTTTGATQTLACSATTPWKDHGKTANNSNPLNKDKKARAHDDPYHYRDTAM